MPNGPLFRKIEHVDDVGKCMGCPRFGFYAIGEIGGHPIGLTGVDKEVLNERPIRRCGLLKKHFEKGPGRPLSKDRMDDKAFCGKEGEDRLVVLRLDGPVVLLDRLSMIHIRLIEVEAFFGNLA